MLMKQFDIYTNSIYQHFIIFRTLMKEHLIYPQKHLNSWWLFRPPNWYIYFGCASVLQSIVTSVPAGAPTSWFGTHITGETAYVLTHPKHYGNNSNTYNMNKTWNNWSSGIPMDKSTRRDKGMNSFQWIQTKQNVVIIIELCRYTFPIID